MTERRGDQGFTVAPQRLAPDGGGPARRRIRRIGFALVLAISAGIFTIGWLGPRLSDRPSFEISFFATPKPSITPSPRPTRQPVDNGEALATPLPSITRPDGPVPTGQVAFVTDGFQILDLATGAISRGPTATAWRDAIFGASAGSGWTCVCVGGALDAGAPSVPIRIVGIGPTGATIDSTVIAEPANPTENGQQGLTLDVDAFDGGRRGLLALATRHGSSWRFALSPIDVDGRRLGAPVLVGDVAAPPPRPVPSPRPSLDPSIPDQDEMYVDGPHVRVAPGGRVAFMWGLIQRYNPARGDDPTIKVFAWRVALRADGSIEAVTVPPGLRAIPAYCAISFATADRLVWFCPHPADGSAGYDGTWQFGTLDLDGRIAGTTELTLGANAYTGQFLFDRANGKAYLWDATGLTITRIDVHSLAVEQMTFDAVARSSSGLAPAGGSAPVDWHGADSAVRQYGYTNITGGLDGERLYAVGLDPEPTGDSGNQPSRGVFVIDRSTLALVDRWAPAANYLAVTALPGGLVAAAGMPGIKEDGRFAPWEGSLTIHDGTDGRILVRFGQLGTDNPPLVLDP